MLLPRYLPDLSLLLKRVKPAIHEKKISMFMKRRNPFSLKLLWCIPKEGNSTR
ncbi:hypothetical protein HMPREF1145_1356 [Oribacterium parvum ACB8]|nr:hypothetical protein HMPREF1145_1356 [Oribacterium parvum ACB8]